MASKSGLIQIECEDWNSVLLALDEAKARLHAADETLWFRGCRDDSYKLLPSLMRDTNGLSGKDHDQFEEDIFFEFQARATELRRHGLTEWEYLFFGRHYGVPTRVLDWTDTFGVSLYFALERREREETVRVRNPAIWIINPYALNKRTWELSEIILPRYLGLHRKRFWDFGELLAENGAWPWDGPVAIYPIQINDRVRAQRGWFTIHGNDRRALEDQVPQCLVKIVLKQNCIPSARKFLKQAGFDRFSIYPDLESCSHNCPPRYLRKRTVCVPDIQRTLKVIVQPPRSAGKIVESSLCGPGHPLRNSSGSLAMFADPPRLIFVE